MALQFTFRETPVTIKNAKDADPQAIGLALHKVAAANGGRLNTRAALEAARSRRNPLHRHVEWDDHLAAEAHRRNQIGELIRLIVREDDADAESKPQRAFLSLRDKDGTAYHRVDDVMRSLDLQLKVLEAARRDLKAWRARYSELLDICELVQVAEDQLETKIKRRSTDSPPMAPT